MSIVDVIGYPVAQVLKGIHTGLSTVFPADGGLAWGLSIILLTVFVRILLFPVFVKQIRSQRRMQEISPKVKELQKLHKGDRETLNREMMALYKDNNANPIAGCLPLILQLPVFFALFSVLKEFKPDAEPRFGLSAHDLEEGGHARIFGAPISAALNDSSDFIRELGGNSTATRIVAVVMLITMGATTFITQRQMMARNTTTDPTQMQVQKILLYVLPLSFSIFGFSFPIGVLLYWLTTNLWSMGQQFFILKRMPPPNLDGPSAGPKGSGKSTGPKPGPGKGSTALADPAPKRRRGRGVETPEPTPVDLVKDSQVAAGRAAGVAPGATGQPPKKAQQGSRKNRNRKKGRPGGRR